MEGDRRALLGGPRFEAGYLLISAWLLAAAYLDALGYVHSDTGLSPIAPWEDAGVHAGWLALTVWLGATALSRHWVGAAWTRSLPVGYGAPFLAALAMGILIGLDRYADLVLGPQKGLGALVSPTHLGEIAIGAVLVAAPLRAAWLRRETELGVAGAIAAAYLLAALAFATQFADPVRDPLEAPNPIGAGPRVPGFPLSWILEDLGFASIVLQALILSGFGIQLLRMFRLRFGTFTLALGLTGLLGASLKGRWPLALSMLATGVLADLLNSSLRPGADRLSALRAFAVALPALFAANLAIAVAAAYGTWWEAHVLLGSVLAAGAAGWLACYLALPVRHRVSETAGGPLIASAAQRVKEALEALDEPGRLAGSPLLELPILSGGRSERVAELRQLLVEVVKDVAADGDPRRAEAGRVLFDYYVRRVGTLELVAERNHLSRPTLFRRLHQGMELAAERLDELSLAVPR